MQRMSTYFYPNSVTVQCNLDPTVTSRWRTMYQRQVKIYKNVDNVIQFLFKNSDQRAVNVTGWVITFRMFLDSDGITAVTKDSTLGGGISIVDALKGIITVNLKTADLIDLAQPLYNYSLTVTDPLTGIEQVIYTDENYESRGEIFLRDGPKPSVLPSIVVDLPTNNNTTVTSSAIRGDANTFQQYAHHNAQFYFSPTGFTGTIGVEGTLDPLALTGAGIPQVSWGDVTITNSGNAAIVANTSILQYTGQITSDFCTFDGVYTAIRFVVTPAAGNISPGSVTQILYRHA